ncbi:predicted protein [Mycobacterium tuberculosis EAS054]|nr:predicted protein [Mycobacterium tuberculosis EAS054]
MHPAFGQFGYHQRAGGDAQRLCGLADSHGQTALLGREPTRDQPPAGAVATTGGHAAEKQEDTDPQQRMNRCRGVGGRGGQRRAHGHHHPFADVIEQIASGEHRDHQAPAGHRRQQTRVR